MKGVVYPGALTVSVELGSGDIICSYDCYILVVLLSSLVMVNIDI